MEIAAMVALTTAGVATALTCSAPNTRMAALLLSAQAASTGFLKLARLPAEPLHGFRPEALFNLFVTPAELFFCAVASPLAIYLGAAKIEDVAEGLADVRKASALVIATVTLFIVLWACPLHMLPVGLDVLPFSAFMFSLSISFTVTRSNPLRVLVGLNMAKNAFHPLLVKGHPILVLFIHALMALITFVGVYVIKEARKDYGTASISKWRLGR